MEKPAEHIQYVDPDLLRPHPDRMKAGTTLGGDDGRYLYILESIREDGMEEAIKAQANTNIIIGGHTRQRIALQLAIPQVPVVFYDVDDKTAKYMMVTDNHKRIGDERDPMKLAYTFQVVMEHEGHGWGGDRSKSTGETLKDAETIAGAFGLKRASLFRYIELLKLIPQLQHFVSEQKIGIKAGAQLARLAERDQFSVFQSITPEAFEAEYRLTETEAKSFVEAFRFDQVSDTPEEKSKQPNQESISIPHVDYTVTELDSGGYSVSGKGVDEAQEQLQAREWLDQPERRHYLTKVAIMETNDDSTSVQTQDLEQTTVNMARRLLRIEDEDARQRYATRRLQASLYKYTTWTERMESELIPARSVVGDELSEELTELWEQLSDRLHHVSTLMKQITTRGEET